MKLSELKQIIREIKLDYANYASPAIKINVDLIISIAQKIIERDGVFVPANLSNSTYDQISIALYKENNKINKKFVNDLKKYYKLLKPANNYEKHLKKISNIKISNGHEHIRNLALVVNYFIEQQEQQLGSKGEYIGKIGDKIPVILKVTNIVAKKSNYGVYNIYSLKDKDKNRFVKYGVIKSKFESGNKEPVIGSTIKTTIEIKDFQEYKGNKIIVIGKLS